ncbi:hypothetical protein E2C01_086211 [Portunus trituberculatus]|uniref:Uncharacterized protein n=1 Tax=Portunus trituberculatus TaxID=210409 RepID=A0A5B7J4V1_PORTR|nr:hypothetical protein [Portunus trituberculatus]
MDVTTKQGREEDQDERIRGQGVSGTTRMLRSGGLTSTSRKLSKLTPHHGHQRSCGRYGSGGKGEGELTVVSVML